MARQPQTSSPSLSVIVVTFNQEDTIARTLDSVLGQQTDFDFEVIVGDDASTDRTSDICLSYASKYPDRVRYLRREKNLGVLANYMDCILQARGPYLADCAGDDFWVDPDKLQRQFDFLQAHPDVAMVTTDWLCCNSDGSRVRRSDSRSEVTEPIAYEKGELCKPLLMHRVTPHLCTALYRREPVARALRERPETMAAPGWICEDTQIMLTLARAGKTVILPGVSLHYSIDESVSHSDDPARQFDYSLRALDQTLALARIHGIDGKDFRKEMSRRIAHLASLAFRAKDPNRMHRLANLRKANSIGVSPKYAVYRILTH